MEFNRAFLDEEKSQKGVWIDYKEGVRLLIASANNPQFEDLTQKLLQPYASPSKRFLLKEPKLMRSIQIRAMAETILLGWDGFVENGNPVEYTVEKAELLLTKSPEIRLLVQEESSDLEKFEAAAREDAAANLKSGSDMGNPLG